MRPSERQENDASVPCVLALHHVDVFDRDGAAVAEVDDQDRQADGRFSRRDRQDEHREDLPDQIAGMDENATKLIFTASSISSIDIKMMMTFLRFRKIPKMPSVNRIAATVR